mgnify:CR=1 FL=1
MNYDEFIKSNPKMLELDPTEFPFDIFVSTMTLTCKLPVLFYIKTIASKIPLSLDFVQYVSYGNNGEICRSLITQRRKRRKTNTKTKRKNFYNQVTMIIKINNTNRISVKLFKNGSIQITGCKLISSVVWCLDKLFKILDKPIIEMDNKTGKEMKTYFVEYYMFLDIRNIYSFRIVMINTNFDIKFKINRERLYECLRLDGYDCTYDSARYAGVIIKYANTIENETIDEQKIVGFEKSCKGKNANNKKHNKKPITSIFIFGNGSIIITGSRCYRYIIECYKFINAYLINNYKKICIT